MTAPHGIPESMLTAEQASDAELIQRMLARDDLGPHAHGPAVEVIIGRGDQAEAEMERRKAERA